MRPARAVFRSRAWQIRSIFGLALALAACGPSEKEQQAKLDEVQNKAKEELAAAQKAATEKLAAAEKEIATLKASIAQAGDKAREEAQSEIAKVKEESDKLAAEASLALTKVRSAYKESANKQLQTISNEVNELGAKVRKAPAKSKAAIDKSLKDITAKRQTLQKDIAAFDKATVEQLKAAKAKVDVDLAHLKQAVAGLRAKLPKD